MGNNRAVVAIKVVLLLVPLLGLLIYKYIAVAVSLGDTNIYFYTAYQMLKGRSLYQDIVFTNLPLFPIISAFYFLLTRGNIYLFGFSATVESFIVALLIFWAVHIDTRRFLPSLLASLIYAFSVYNLTYSSFQLGIFTASAFSVGAYICIRKNKPFLAGGVLSLCFLTKAYFIPVILALSFFAISRFSYRQIVRWTIGVLVGLTPLIPFLLTSAGEMYQYLFGFSLHRVSNINKFEEAKAFFYYDFIYLLIIPLTLVLKVSNRKFWIILFLLFAAFFLVFSDFYNVYFGMIIPFLAIAAGSILSRLLARSSNYKIEYILLIFLPAFILFNVLRYGDTASLHKIRAIEQIVAEIRNINPDYVYGSASVAPAIAYLSGRPLLGGVIDTNRLFFDANILNKGKLTEMAVENHTAVVAFGVENRGLVATTLPDVINTDVLDAHCSFAASYPVEGKPPINRIILYTCPGQN